ncbi:MAG: hypothetical protein AB1631_25175 [Acidobacteriota bacterium]
MSEQFPGLTITYIGHNASHRNFRASLANAKALAYVLADNNSMVLRGFLDRVEEAKRRSPDGSFAIGLTGGRSTTTNVQLAIHITGTEVALIDSELGGFVPQALALVYREVHRVFETYLVDLFEEIAKQDKRVLFSNQKITHEVALGAANSVELQQIIIDERKAELTRAGFFGLEKVFNGMGLPIVPMSDPPLSEQVDIRQRLILLSAIRNLIEHNRSEVNREFENLAPTLGYIVGDRIAITVTELGDALSAVEWTADDLNRRAIEKFGIDQPVRSTE